jgi:hypothetical protein
VISTGRRTSQVALMNRSKVGFVDTMANVSSAVEGFRAEGWPNIDRPCLQPRCSVC